MNPNSSRHRGSALHRLRAVALGAALLCSTSILTVSTNVQSAFAKTDSCGQLCSGADGSTGTNSQGNAPQLYVGEVGTAYHDFGGGTGPCPSDPNTGCYNTTAAGNALTRQTKNTGLGIAFYYFAYGPSDTFGYPGSAVCWGYYQGWAAVTDIQSYFNSNAQQMGQTWVAMDMDAEDQWGWGTGANDRLTFDGFFEYLEGDSNPPPNASSTCKNNSNQSISPDSYELFQPGLYAGPNTWYVNLDHANLSIPNTPVWTTEPACYSTSQPESLTPAQDYSSGGSGTWPNYTNHMFGWQFWISNCSPADDWDTSASPQYLPFFGTYLY